MSRESGDIAVEMTCIGCENVRVHVESENSGDGGVTVEIVSVSRLETTVSLRFVNRFSSFKSSDITW